MADSMITYRGVVYPWHCDHMGHMNVMWYVGKFDEATWQLFSAIGITPDYVRTSGRGMAAVEQRIAYRREVRAGDVVIQRGTNHGWANRSDRACRIAFILIDGKYEDGLG